MTRPAQVVAAIAGLAAPFLVPWPVAIVLAIPLAFFEPIAGLACGVLADVLYFTPGAGQVPYGTLAGAAGALTAVLVRRFVQTRIM